MHFKLYTGLAAAMCVVFASCYPVNENPPRKKANQSTQKPTAEQVKQQQEAAAKKKQEGEIKKQQEATTTNVTETPRETAPSQQPTQPPVEQKRVDYAFANKVPGKDGFVFSPYNNKVVDVRDIPSGTLVQDPTYPASEKKYFRVP